MIEMAGSLSQIEKYSGKDIYSVRILSLAKAYGCCYSFASFYRQIDVSTGRISALISALDEDITVSFIPEYSDLEEIKAFALAKGFSSILCDEYLKIDGIGFSSGAVMKSDKKAEMDSDFAVIDEYPHLLDLYNFIDYDEKGFDSWYVDISHRIRHNSALAASLNIGGEIISSAVLSSIYNNDAVITAVRTNIKFRNRGYASALVSSLCCCVKGTVYLMREENRNEKFYKKLGFENCGIWRMYK